MKTEKVEIDGDYLKVIPDGAFTKEEIEWLRDYEQWALSMDSVPHVANFLPDDKRPAGVKKL